MKAGRQTDTPIPSLSHTHAVTVHTHTIRHTYTQTSRVRWPDQQTSRHRRHRSIGGYTHVNGNAHAEFADEDLEGGAGEENGQAGDGGVYGVDVEEAVALHGLWCVCIGQMGKRELL